MLRNPMRDLFEDLVLDLYAMPFSTIPNGNSFVELSLASLQDQIL